MPVFIFLRWCVAMHAALWTSRYPQACAGVSKVDTRSRRGEGKRGRGGIDHCCRGEWIEEQLEVERVSLKEAIIGTFKPLGGLFTNSALRRSTLVMYYLWFTNSFVYYGLTLNSGSLLPGSLHINFVIGGALEVLKHPV